MCDYKMVAWVISEVFGNVLCFDGGGGYWNLKFVYGSN